MLFLNIYASSITRDMIFAEQKKSLESKAQLITTALLQLDDLSASKTQQAINSLEDLRVTRTIVTDASGMVRYDSLQTGNAEGRYALFSEIVQALRGSDVFFGSYDSGAIRGHMAMPLERGGVVLGAVYLMEYDTDQGALVRALQLNIFRISIALEVGVILFSIFFSAAFSRRLRKILHSLRMMRAGNYSYKIKPRGHDEVAYLSHEFNTLAERLHAAEQQRRQFVSDASHELKTPLASIKLLSDSILQNEMDVEMQREFIGDIGREADRLGRLSQKLLLLTKLDSELEEEREIIDAQHTVRKVSRMLQPLAGQRGIEISTEIAPNCTVMLVEDDLYQILFNLAENAIKYNTAGGWVGLSLQREQDNIVIRVEDSGVGIPLDAMEHVFERFYRVDKARSREAGGAGLGLSIVHDMVARNFGTIAVSPREAGGTAFTVTFPYFEVQEDAR
ncbi:MAG: HAMP domain-containing histidine kinase [Oscillospiraceae bacterium]|nr:HAMP domain-containing histidine kinase [Oscillospiraceae bacterium]